jgi:hypothetical protein
MTLCCQKYDQPKHSEMMKGSVTSYCQKWEQPNHSEMIKSPVTLRYQKYKKLKHNENDKEFSDFMLPKIRATKAQ